jgi:hypothetical protein
VGRAFCFCLGPRFAAAPFLSGDEDVIFEGHDLAAAEEGLFDEGQRPVFEPFVFMPRRGLFTAAFELVGPVELA